MCVQWWDCASVRLEWDSMLLKRQQWVEGGPYQKNSPSNMSVLRGILLVLLFLSNCIRSSNEVTDQIILPLSLHHHSCNSIIDRYSRDFFPRWQISKDIILVILQKETWKKKNSLLGKTLKRIFSNGKCKGN